MLFGQVSHSFIQEGKESEQIVAMVTMFSDSKYVVKYD